MKQIFTLSILVSFFFIVNLIIAPVLRCEYYEYIDKNGVKCFTDDNSRIPPKQNKKIRVHKEKYDDMTDEEKAEKIKADQESLKEIRSKQEEYSKKYKAEQEKIEKEESEAAKKKAIEKQRTPVKIFNNQILVPVTIGYGKKLQQQLFFSIPEPILQP
jgi:hypothetical protein